MFAYDIHTFDTVSSTNDIVKEVIAGGGQIGYVAVAEKQIVGHGMRGRTWVSPRGGLYMSICLKPNCEQSRLPEITKPIGVCIKDVLQEFSHEKLDVKEPNDIVLAGKCDIPHKLVGISTEFISGYLCLGIGVNVFNLSKFAYNIRKIDCSDRRNVAIYLFDIAFHNKLITLDMVRYKILFALRDKLDIWE